MERVYNLDGEAVKKPVAGKPVKGKKVDLEALLYNEDGSVWGNGHGPFDAQ